MGVVLGKLWLVVLYGQHLVMRSGVVSVLSSQVGCAPWEIVSLDSMNISCLGSEMVMTCAVRDNWSSKGWVEDLKVRKELWECKVWGHDLDFDAIGGRSR